MRNALRGLTLALCGLLGAGRTAAAAACAVETTPAATLLLPSFQVDVAGCAQGSGVTTLASVSNASAGAVLAHVVLWSDLSVPVLDFDVYLTGYDVQSFNLCDLLVNGLLPQTASAGQDPADVISPKGPLSQDINFASCSAFLPSAGLPASFVTHLQNALTGRFSNLLGGCAGLAYGDNIARGYMTVDTVNKCTLRIPGDPGYFAADGSGDATDQNVLLGDYAYVNSATRFAQGSTMIHLQADPTLASGQYTFYGRYVNWTASDHRKRLPGRFFARYINAGPSGITTTMTAWRDPKVAQHVFSCGTSPSWYPLGQAQVVLFDEQEHVATTGPLLPFPTAAGQAQIGGAMLPSPFVAGWILFDLNATAGSAPPADPSGEQAWVDLSMASGGGSFTLGHPAFELDSCSGTSPVGAASAFYTLPPCRLLDTRGADAPALAAGVARSFAAAGRCGVPAGARAVSVNVTVANASAGGDLRLFAADLPLPLADVISFGAGKTRSNNAILGLSAGGAFTAASGQPSGTVDLIVDLNGYFQ